MADEKRALSASMVVVSLRWNGDPIATRVARPGERVVLGDAEDTLAPLPRELLGERALVIAESEGGPHAVVPKDKVASITGPGGTRLVVGPARVALAIGEEASMLFGAFDVTIAAHANEPMAGRRRKVAAGAWVHTAVVAAVHAALLFAGSRAAMAAAVEDEGTTNVEELRAYLAAGEERSALKDPVAFDEYGKQDAKHANGKNGDGHAGGGERHEGKEGKAGATSSRSAKGHWTATANDPSGDSLPSMEDLEIARKFGLVSILTADAKTGLPKDTGDFAWGNADAFAAVGGMMGRIAGESEGFGGLALTGTGEGGGGRGDGIGLGTIGTIGHTDGRAGDGTGGAGSPQTIGFGRIWSGSWDGWGKHRPRVAVWRGWGHGHWVSGRLPPEAIQRIIRQNFGRFRACYEKGLQRNPQLAGRITTRFVIGHDGSVSSVGDGGSDLPDGAVRACVHRAFYGLSFPQPEGGIVAVTYPIVFTSNE